MAYNQSVRTLMNNAGYDNSKIGYNNSNGYVTYNGQNFMKPQMNVNGTTFTDQASFDKAHQAYQNSLPKPQNTATTAAPKVTPVATAPNASPVTYPGVSAGTQTAPSAPASNAVPNYNDIIAQVYNKISNPQPYDVYSSPEYAAAQSAANYAAHQAIGQGQEALGASGMARSSDLARFAQNAQNEQNQRLLTQVVPQLISQHNELQQQQLNNLSSLLSPIMQGQQFDFNKQQDIANLTGNFTSPDVQNLVNRILQDKQRYASANPNDRNKLSADANSARSALAAMGYDPSLFGANETIQQAQGNVGSLGVPTLEAQKFKYQQEQDALANAFKNADTTGVIGPVLGAQYNLPANTPTLQAKQLSQNYAVDAMNAQTSRMNANTNAAQQAWAQDPNNPAYKLQQAQAGYYTDHGNYYNNQTPGNSSTSYKTNPNFLDDYNSAIKDPAGFGEYFNQHAQDFINQYGIDGYNALKALIPS